MNAALAKLFRKALFFWTLLFAIAFLNGACREFVLGPLLGTAVARPLSGLTLMALIAAGAWVFVRRNPFMTIASATLVGLLWVVMTLAGEIVLFVLMMGEPLDTVVRTLTPAALASGDLFLAVLLWLALLPALIVWLHGR